MQHKRGFNHIALKHLPQLIKTTATEIHKLFQQVCTVVQEQSKDAIQALPGNAAAQPAAHCESQDNTVLQVADYQRIA
jgi:hypothetical protein